MARLRTSESSTLCQRQMTNRWWVKVVIIISSMHSRVIRAVWMGCQQNFTRARILLIRIGEYQEKLLAVHDITGGLSHPRVVVLEVAGQYFGYSRIRYLRQSESCGGTDQRTPFFKEREKALRG